MNHRISNVPAPDWPRYSLAERDRRWTLARELMDETGVEALIVTGERQNASPMNAPDNWLTNDRPAQFLVFPRKGDPVLMVWSNQIIAAHAEALKNDEDVWIAPENMHVGRSPQQLQSVFSDLGLAKARVGVVGLEPTGAHQESFISQVSWERLIAALPGVQFVSVGNRFYEIMLVKSAEEIAVLRQAANAGEHMCAAMMEACRVGALESDVAAAVMSACFRNGAHNGFLLLQSGRDNTAWGAPNWTVRPQRPRTLAAGDVVLAELFPCYGLLETQQQMAVALGEPSDTHKRGADICRQALEAGMERLKPGLPFAEAALAMQTVIEKAGGWFLTPQIHSINPLGPLQSELAKGVEDMIFADRYPRPGPRPSRGFEIVLRPGMSLAMQPNCHFGHTRMNIGGTVLITENGAEELNHLCNHLQIVPAQ